MSVQVRLRGSAPDSGLGSLFAPRARSRCCAGCDHFQLVWSCHRPSACGLWRALILFPRHPARPGSPAGHCRSSCSIPPRGPSRVSHPPCGMDPSAVHRTATLRCIVGGTLAPLPSVSAGQGLQPSSLGGYVGAPLAAKGGGGAAAGLAVAASAASLVLEAGGCAAHPSLANRLACALVLQPASVAADCGRHGSGRWGAGRRCEVALVRR